MKFRDIKEGLEFYQEAPDTLVLLATQLYQFMLVMHELELEVTSWRSGRTTNPHADGRALDLSVTGWPKSAIMAALDFCNSNFPQPYMLTAIYEVSDPEDLQDFDLWREDGQAVYSERATGPHIHLQVHDEDRLGELNWIPVIPGPNDLP